MIDAMMNALAVSAIGLAIVVVWALAFIIIQSVTKGMRDK